MKRKKNRDGKYTGNGVREGKEEEGRGRGLEWREGRVSGMSRRAADTNWNSWEWLDSGMLGEWSWSESGWGRGTWGGARLDR